MKRIILSVMTVAVFFGLIACGDRGGQEEPAAIAEEENLPVEFILYNGAEPETIDPALISGVPEHRIYLSLFEGLMSYDPETADPIPGVAESWKISSDGLTYTFKLREDAVWSDGTPVTAQQFVDSWLRFLNPETAAEYAYMMNMVIEGAAEYNSGEAGPEAVQIRALDERTFQFDLTGPAPYVLGMLAHYAFSVVPTHVIDEYGDDWTEPENFVGNGPFVLKEWSPQEKLTVVPNETYWNRKAVQLDQVTYLPIEDNNTAYNMYKNGELDWSTEVPNDAIDEAKLRDDHQSNAVMIVYYYVFNTERPPLDDARVRRALSLAVDREEIVEKIRRKGDVAAYGIVPPMKGYQPPETFSDNAEKARQLLAQAGYPDGEGFPVFEVLYNTSETHKKIAEYVQQRWKETLNIDVELVNQEWSTYLNNRQEGKFDIARAGWAGDYKDPNSFLDLFISTSALNGGNYTSAEYDELIEKASTMPGGEKRYQVLAQAKKLLMEDMPIAPFYFYSQSNMIDLDKWGGWYTNVLDIHPTKDIYMK
ncbi:MAG: peptide ABC transporter substrate-binding protein [Spirochaetales bacterium]|nr:peptide ABC transporter substrate-binding protein [Spirochaetales bacterium]MCF7938187.1 peptide ABC transporter substrate-binding protein [Spirochaetales bacterium]